jgi:hypothetical protein
MDPEVVNRIISVVISAGAGVLASVIAAASLRRKNDADASKSISEAVENIVPPLNARIDVLAAELVRVRRGVGMLIGQIRAMGCDPVWTPEMDCSSQSKRQRKIGDRQTVL